MRRGVVVIFLLLFGAFRGPAEAAVYASIVVDEKTGEVLHAVNPDKRTYPASLTKIMTLYLVFEAINAKRLTFDQQLPVSVRAARQPRSKLHLKAGSTISVQDAIAALITKSANDVATTVAEALAGTEEKFAEYMTVRARQLGMTRTTFRNASGLPNPEQVSTARDMARLVMAMRRDFPQFFHYFSMKSFKYHGREHRNHNRLLTRYEGTDGVKTGYVNASGYNIAVSVERDGHRLIGVVFGGQTASRRDHVMMVLLNRVYKAIEAGDNPPIVTADTAPWHASLPTPAGKIRLAHIAPAAGVEESDDWAVQVGAYERFAPAHLAASRAIRLAPELGTARILIEQSGSGPNRVYRAQLTGLTETRAQAACRALVRKKVSCRVTQAGEGTAQGDR